jgi:hypothetical protein
MMRRGVVILSADPFARAFVDDILAEMLSRERKSIKLRRAHTCIAALGAPVRRRLLIIDGAPPDLGAGALVEKAKEIDPQLPIMLVRHDWNRPPFVQNGVRVCSGPFVSRSVQRIILDLLGSGGEGGSAEVR